MTAEGHLSRREESGTNERPMRFEGDIGRTVIDTVGGNRVVTSRPDSIWMTGAIGTLRKSRSVRLDYPEHHLGKMFVFCRTNHEMLSVSLRPIET
jgi:hypothetical protein